MKIQIILFCIMALYASKSAAQISKALNEEVTKSPEIIYSGFGKLTLETGEQIEGDISHSLITQNRVTIVKTDGKKETYSLKEVKHFRIGSDFYEKAEIPTVAIKDPHFARLLSSENSPVRVYYIAWQENIAFGTDASAGVWPTHQEYYVLFPSIGKLRSLESIDFVPFAKKVSKLVEDCSVLAEKIRNKDKGYSLSLVATANSKVETFINIANGYLDCR